jgi:DnaA family protein
LSPVAAGDRQLPLSLNLRSDNRFANFIVDAANAGTVHALRDWLARAEPVVFYLFGAQGSGRTHLLQAAALESSAVYLPLGELAAAEPEAVCEGLEAVALTVLDDIDRIAADPRWCEALFHLFNRIVAADHRLLVSARVAPATLDCALADLRSRLSWGGSFRLHPLDDDGRLRLLQVRMAERGLDIGGDVAAFILSHCARDSASLLQLVERLDRQSLVQKRRLTIPFVKAVIEESTSAGRERG